MIIVIADDLTGAAEIAGIAWKHSLQVNLAMVPANNPSMDDCDVLVMATDTRSGTADEAAACIRQVLSLWLEANTQGHVFFKKTDSALRGHIVTELDTMLTALSLDKALLIAQNPSKGRVIRNGTYYINGTPLHETAFSYDPEFPARSSIVEELLAGAHSLPLCEDIRPGISVADAQSDEEIMIQLGKADDNTLLAGGADCFEALLNSRKKYDDTLIICGSTLSTPLHIGIPAISMPEDVFHGAAPDNWIQEIIPTYQQSDSLILSIGHKTTGGKAYAVRLRNTMAQAACCLIDVHRPKRLIIEGGATAYAILQRLGWTRYLVKKENAPGVVTISYTDDTSTVDIVLKPGSYPWKSSL